MSDRERPKDAGDPVIIPRDAPPDDFAKPVWEPGTVDVIFKQAVSPEILIELATPPLNAQPSDAALKPTLFNILQRYGLTDATYSFDSLEDVEPLAGEGTSTENAIEYSRKNYITLSFPNDKDVDRIAEELEQLEEVERAAPVPKVVPPSTPKNEPKSGEPTSKVVFNPPNQWYIYRCKADRAWDLGASGTGVVIADIDFGFIDTHEDLSSRIELRYNSYDESENVSRGDSKSHGTAVLGLVGAADNDIGIIGFAFGASLWAIQANTGKGPKPKRNPWVRAIDFVRTTDSGGRRKIIMLEVQTADLRNLEMSPVVNKAIRDAISAGIVVCVAAGNGNKPVSIDDKGKSIPPTGSILVGATVDDRSGDRINRRAWFSNYGDEVVVSAPGDPDFDLTCGPDNTYRPGFGGTSGATPKVAGAIALMLEKNPGLSHKDIRKILNDTGTKIINDDPTKPIGKFLDVEAAVNEAINRRHRPLLLRFALALLRLLKRRAA